MHINWLTLVLQLLNFLVLVWLLQRFLYRPVLRMIDARRAAIAQQYAEAQQVQASAQKRLAALDAQSAAMESEQSTALKAAAADAERQLSLRRAQAERDAQALLDDARKQLALEREQLLAEARAAAFELAAQITRRLIAAQPPSLRTQAWFEQIAQQLGALPQTEREALAAQLADGATLTIVTALALGPQIAEQWNTRLQAVLGTPMTVRYAVDPALIAGAELRFPQATLAFTAASTLATLRSELQVNANAH